MCLLQASLKIFCGEIFWIHRHFWNHNLRVTLREKIIIFRRAYWTSKIDFGIIGTFDVQNRRPVCWQSKVLNFILDFKRFFRGVGRFLTVPRIENFNLRLIKLKIPGIPLRGLFMRDRWFLRHMRNIRLAHLFWWLLIKLILSRSENTALFGHHRLIPISNFIEIPPWADVTYR